MTTITRRPPPGALTRDQVDHLVDLALEMVHYEAEALERGDDIDGGDLVEQFTLWRARLMALVGE